MTNFKAALTAGALALALSAASGPSAQAQTRAEVAAVEDGLADAIGKMKPYQEIIIEAEDIFIDVLDHITEAFEKALKPASAAEAKQWSDAWEAQSRARLEALRRRINAAPTVTQAELAVIAGKNNSARMLKLAEETTRSAHKLVQSAQDIIDRTAQLAPLAATGDPEAIDKLANETISATIAMVEIENAGLEASIATVRLGHPQRSLSQSGLAINNASVEILLLSGRALRGEPTDPQGASRRMLEQIALAQTAARRMPAEAAASMANLRKDASADSASLLNRLQNAMDSYTASTETELEIARLLTVAAEAVAKEDDETVDKLFDEMEPLLEKRVAIQMERVTYMTQ